MHARDVDTMDWVELRNEVWRLRDEVINFRMAEKNFRVELEVQRLELVQAREEIHFLAQRVFEFESKMPPSVEVPNSLHVIEIVD